MTLTPFDPRACAALLAGLTTLSTWCGPAACQEPTTEPPTPPKYQFLRHRENWSTLPSFTTDHPDLHDPLKFVRLNEDGSFYATFGGAARLRAEGWNNFNFGGATSPIQNDDLFLLTRILFYGDFHFGDTFRVFAEAKTALASDRDLMGGKRSIDEDEFALQQLFFDVRFGLGEGSFTLRPGRQMLQYGKQRLVSPLPWANALRTWDGISGLFEVDAWSVDTFATRFVPTDQDGVNSADPDNAFYGVYASRAARRGVPGFDAYWLGLHNEQASYNGSTGSENRQTFGARIGGDFGSKALDYDVEGAVQVGSLGGDDILAGMFGGQVGRRFADTKTKPRVWIGLDYGSGDANPDDDKSGTFNQLYPLGHAYLGYIDEIGRQNILDASIGASCTPTKNVTLALGNHAFWVPSRADALYHAGGGVVRPGGQSDSSQVGFEVDLTAAYRLGRHIDFLLGYSHFFAGPLIEQTGASEDIDFAYFSVQYTF